MPDDQERLDAAANWLRNNQDKKGTPEWDSVVGAYTTLRAPQAAPQPSAPPQSIMRVTPPSQSTAPQPPPDYSSMSWDDLQGHIAAKPEQDRVKAVNAWGDAQEKIAAPGRSDFPSVARSVARGVPGGTFLDEAQARISDWLPKSAAGLWRGAGTPYDETVARERAYDRRLSSEHPVADFAGNVVGGVAATPAKLAGTLANTAGGFIQGYGEGEGGPFSADRFYRGGTGAATAAGLSLGLRGAGGIYNRYTRVTPEVQKAAGELAVDTPFFVRSDNPRVQAAGRRLSQNTAGSSDAAMAEWAQLQDALRGRAEQAQQRITGAPAQTAPYHVGAQVRPGMESAVKDIGTEMGRLSDEITAPLMPTYRGTPTAVGQQVQDIITNRIERGHTNPTAGLDQATNLATRPEGVSMKGFRDYISETGQSLGRPELTPRALPKTEEALLFKAARGADEPRMVREAAGPWGNPAAAEATLRANVPRQAALAGLRDEIANAVEKRDNEGLVKLAYQAATLKGGTTHLDQLGTVMNALDPAQRSQLGAGVLAHMQNQAQTPQALGKLINQIPEDARRILFGSNPQLMRNVESLRVLGGRMGELEGVAHRGSAQTLGSAMGNSVLGKAASFLAPAGVLGTAAHMMGAAPEAALLAGGTAAGLRGLYAGGRALDRRLIRTGLPLPQASDRADELANILTGGLTRASSF